MAQDSQTTTTASPETQKLPSSQIEISDAKIESFLHGEVIHTSPDAAAPSPEIQSKIDGLLKEEGGLEHLKAMVRDISAKFNVPAPDIVFTHDPVHSAPLSAKIGNRNIIVFNEKSLGLIADIPQEKWGKWDYMEGIVAHEIAGHLKNDDNQVLDRLHPVNNDYAQAGMKRLLGQGEILSGLSLHDNPRVVQAMQDTTDTARAVFRDELARLEPRKIPPSTQEIDIARELAADRQAALATGKPGALNTYLAWTDKESGTTPAMYDAMEKAGVLDHPKPSTRSEQLVKLEQEMNPDKKIHEPDKPKQEPPVKVADGELVTPLGTPPSAERAAVTPLKTVLSA